MIRENEPNFVSNITYDGSMCNLCIDGSPERLTFPDRCNYQSALLVYKTLNDNAPSYMTEIISTENNATYHLRSLSHKDLSLSTRPKTKYMMDTCSYYSLNIWNNIPLQIRKISNENHFKKAYKEYLFKLFCET